MQQGPRHSITIVLPPAQRDRLRLERDKDESERWHRGYRDGMDRHKKRRPDPGSTWHVSTDASGDSCSAVSKGDLKAVVDLSCQLMSTRVTPGRMIELSVSCSAGSEREGQNRAKTQRFSRVRPRRAPREWRRNGVRSALHFLQSLEDAPATPVSQPVATRARTPNNPIPWL